MGIPVSFWEKQGPITGPEFALRISLFLYACESWTIAAELERRMQGFEMRMLPKVIEHFVQRPCHQEGVCRKIKTAIGDHNELLTKEKKNI